MKKRNKTVREEWSTEPPRSSPLIQSVAQPVLASPAVRKPKLSKEGQFYMCSECPYSAKKWMTAFDHMKKNINSKGGKGEEEELLTRFFIFPAIFPDNLTTCATLQTAKNTF